MTKTYFVCAPSIGEVRAESIPSHQSCSDTVLGALRHADRGDRLYRVDITVAEMLVAPDLREYDASERGMAVAR